MLVGVVVLLGFHAQAENPVRDVQRVDWARPFLLDVPVVYRHTPEAREVRSGWLLQLQVDPAYQQPHPIHTPVLWVDSTVAVRTNWRSSCAVVWVPEIRDPSTSLIFFASTELPERLDRKRREGWLKTAQDAGVKPPLFGDVAKEVLPVHTFTELMDLATERSRACTTPTER